MSKTAPSIACFALLLALAGPAFADWDPGDPYKMHFPQLPDPNGWDVACGGLKALADDWQCTQTGPVAQVHLWCSSRGDVLFQLDKIVLAIFADGPSVPFPQPGDLLWHVELEPPAFTVRQYGTGDQGWYNPYSDDYQRSDHSLIWQINIVDIPSPFVQQEGETYWLALNLAGSGPDGVAELGWKTSQDHWGNDAVRMGVILYDPNDPNASKWYPLYDPVSSESLDLAFVISTVPEPATTGLLAVGGAAILVRRRRRRVRSNPPGDGMC